MGIYKYNNAQQKTLWRLTAFLLLLMLCTISAKAELTRTARIELNQTHEITYIGPDSYVTLDPDNSLAYQVVVNRHQNNLRGTRQNRDVIRLSSDGTPVWLLFSVTNNSEEEDWVLDFGRVVDGRTALAKKTTLHNATSGEIIADINMFDEEKQNIGRAFNNRAVPLKLSEGQTELIAIHITPENTLSETISPYLISADHYVESLNPGSRIFDFFVYLFFAAIIGVFIAISYIRQNPHYLFFSVYYLLNATLFHVINSTFFSPLPLLGDALIFLYIGLIALGLLMTRSFFRINFENHTENTLLIAAGAFTLITGLFSLLLLGNSMWGNVVIYAAAGISMLIMAVLAFLKGQDGQYAGVHYAAGWMITLSGLTISALSSMAILSANAFYLNAYWFALFPQAILFILSVKKRIEMLEEEDRHTRSRENREVQSRARLKHSKESADQARLLRVIERERELMAELREREMQRTEEMRVAKEMAVDANRAKSAFLAVVSHEIRTPMTGILGILRLLGDTSLNKEQKDYLLSIQTSGDTMMALLNDILDFEKIERGSMDLEEIDFDLAKLAQGVVMLMSGHAADKGLHLTSDISTDFPNYLVGDPTRVRQILLNLVNNAVKFTQRGEVTIHLKATPIDRAVDKVDADYEIYIGVEDTGIGISEEAQNKLFSPFEQADNTVARRFGGTGLGLAICKRLVEAMGGAITIKSEEGEGSTFFFSILMNSGHAENVQDQAQGSSYASDLPPMDLLVIEDNEMNRKVLLGFLEKGGHQVHLSNSGEEALNALEGQSFDAIFTDINLTGMSGIETTKTIRTLPDQKKAQTPIIAISGNISEKDIQSYEAAGMNGFLPKPIIPENLYEILEQIHNGPQPTPSEAEPTETPPPAPIAPEDYKDIALEDDFDSFEEAEIEAKQPTQEEESPVLNLGIIQALLDSLGAEQFKGLMDGYTEKADEIVGEIEALKDSDAADALRDRAHELKGMAANFGVQETSDISDIIERAAQNNDLETARKAIEKLPDANRRAKEAIIELLKE